MPLYDERTMLEELRAFPEPKMAAGAEDRIMEQLRKREPQVRARARRTRSMNRAMTGLLACLAVIALIGLGSWLLTSDRTETASQPGTEADAPYRKAAERELRELGLKGDYQWEAMRRDSELWLLRTSKSEVTAIFNPDDPQPASLSATVAAGKLPSAYKSQKKAAEAALREEGLVNTGLRTVEIVRGAGETVLYFQMNEGNYVGVDRDSGFVVSSRLAFKPEAMNAELQAAALRALEPLAGGRALTFTSAERTVQKGQPTQWQFTNEDGHYRVLLTDGPMRILQVHYPEETLRIRSAQEALKIAGPLIREIFGTDTAGYGAYGGREIGGYVLQKKGQPSFSVLLRDLDEGSLLGLVRWDPR
ncbi:hypothetical protein F4V43_17665 [Paenibacillus spiritus]|uniref:Uncharacterized protein n=1 Tax=Paenibacillus spiritus TaxID=2496557 RepID=A0A5J5FVE3_9BACL|nr:hypothetical protein [Paenibacillus spiritus]KAA8997587.1 hypothetical protein F4V43_17665 [Paenibacillus spiritus]